MIDAALDTASGVVPESSDLARVLSPMLSGDGPPLRVISREPNPLSSTFATEIVTLRRENDADVHVLCKYGAEDPLDSFGHRRGVAYEGVVYRDVLEPAHAAVPRFYGLHNDQRTGAKWLVLEFLSNAEMVNRDELVDAVTWLGHFQQDMGEHREPLNTLQLIRYDADYYAGWARRTRESAMPIPGLEWIASVCDRFVAELVPLLVPEPILIHGEFYPKNVMVSQSQIRPVDWESAALGAGEIDLATMTEGWPSGRIRTCVRQYVRSRWADGAPASFPDRLQAARVYLHLRWLGDEWSACGNKWRIADLKRLGVSLGWL